MDKQNEIISRNLTALIDRKGVSQLDVATAIGITPQSLNQYIKGTACPRMKRVQLLADYFGVEISEITDEKTTPTTDEDKLLIAYRKLSPQGKKLLLQQAEFYLGMYQKWENDYGEYL